MKQIIMNKWWLIVKKQEMTKIWIDDKFVAVTLVKVVPQELVRYKTVEKDWYVAAVVWVEKSESKAPKGAKIKYSMLTEFNVGDDFIQNNQIWKVLDADVVKAWDFVDVTWNAIGKGFQGMVKIWHVKGMWATHGHKFTRTWWSKGNRKPRRTMKWHPHAGHMWTQRVTLTKIQILDIQKTDKEQLIVLKGSLPGFYSSVLKLNLY